MPKRHSRPTWWGDPRSVPPLDPCMIDDSKFLPCDLHLRAIKNVDFDNVFFFLLNNKRFKLLIIKTCLVSNRSDIMTLTVDQFSITLTLAISFKCLKTGFWYFISIFFTLLHLKCFTPYDQTWIFRMNEFDWNIQYD